MDVSVAVDREAAQKPDKMFTLKKWNLVAMWSWDVECDTCAICRVQVMGNHFEKKIFIFTSISFFKTYIQLHQYLIFYNLWP